MSSSSEPGLSRLWSFLVYLILFLGRFYASNFESVIQDFELGVPAPCKTNEESELPQPGPHGGEIPEQRDSLFGQQEMTSTLQLLLLCLSA